MPYRKFFAISHIVEQYNFLYTMYFSTLLGLANEVFCWKKYLLEKIEVSEQIEKDLFLKTMEHH